MKAWCVGALAATAATAATGGGVSGIHCGDGLRTVPASQREGFAGAADLFVGHAQDYRLSGIFRHIHAITGRVASSRLRKQQLDCASLVCSFMDGCPRSHPFESLAYHLGELTCQSITMDPILACHLDRVYSQKAPQGRLAQWDVDDDSADDDCIYRYACMCVCSCVCMHACMHACMYACMYVCMYVIMYVCAPMLTH